MVVSAAHFKDITNGYEKRTDGLWTHTGKLVVKGGPVDLPAGSIGTDEIAANAAQQNLGSYLNIVAYSTPQAGVWHETPLQAVVVPTVGGSLRIECALSVSNNVAGAYSVVAVGWNGSATVGLCVNHHGFANYQTMFHGLYYGSFQAGVSVRIGIFLMASGGVSTIWNGAYSSLYVTEQKR